MNYVAGKYPRSIFAADLDSDGEADLAVANGGSNNITVLFNCSPCSCPHEGDLASRPAGDGIIDASDVMEEIGIAFSGSPDIQDTNCPRTRGDVDNNGVANVFDVIYLINTVFGGSANPINPCGP
jgi:hypothetical protein